MICFVLGQADTERPREDMVAELHERDRGQILANDDVLDSVKDLANVVRVCIETDLKMRTKKRKSQKINRPVAQVKCV